MFFSLAERGTKHTSLHLFRWRIISTRRDHLCCRSRKLSTTTGSTSAFNKNHGLDISDPYCNVTEHIASRVGVNLHQQVNHPLCTIKGIIRDYWNDKSNVDNYNDDNEQQQQQQFDFLDDLSPVVSVQQNFDSLRIPIDHVSRQKTDTYYLDPTRVLRCHTSSHQVDLLREGKTKFLVAGDVYRRDEIDSSHYPVFHQMEGVKLFNARTHTPEQIQQDLQRGLDGMAKALFGPTTQVRWVDAYFPFTHPSLEMEVYYQEDWLEVLGCGVIHPEIVSNAGLDPNEVSGWAFGLGLERLAMVLYKIPDIRLFWTTDPRFHNQFQDSKITVFYPYSKYPPCLKDISFWLPSASASTSTTAAAVVKEEEDLFCENDFYEITRGVAGDLVERIELIDNFTHPKTGKTSHCYRITYRSMDRSLTNEEIDELQKQVRQLTAQQLGVELR